MAKHRNPDAPNPRKPGSGGKRARADRDAPDNKKKGATPPAKELPADENMPAQVTSETDQVDPTASDQGNSGVENEP